VLRIGGGPDRPKRDISPEAAAAGGWRWEGEARQGRRRGLGNGGRDGVATKASGRLF
jgi:hypothetical protein